jgi:hypothetical protein
MPVVFRYKSFRFFFYSNEGNPREAMRVHVRDAVIANKELIERTWNDHFA